ncbi:MAG TPA: peptide-methionine (S)-S-oxide reductase [Pedobacter sp.]|nr:peptide-methionine (S)-S-oxide reductase [Pedobacter sp.]
MERIGFGGSCHWCTEAIFLSLIGVQGVQQGWIASSDNPSAYSEAVLVDFDPEMIPLKTLVSVHLHTHSSTSSHRMRNKYRSAVYSFGSAQQVLALAIIQALQQQFSETIITEVVAFGSFKLNKPEYLNYYYSDPAKPFCQKIVNPKLQQLLKDFSEHVDQDKLMHQTGSEK